MKISFSALCFLLLTLAACKKDNSNIGIDLIDDQLGVEYTEGVYLQTHTIIEDSLVTSNRSSTQLGYYEDPVFGPTGASIFSQFLLSTTNPVFGNATCDSVVLSMKFKGHYGTLNPQRFLVYMLDSLMHKDSLYYDHDTIPVNGSPVADVVLTPNPFDSVYISGDSLAPQLRIRLNNSFGNYLLGASAGDLSSNTTWVNYFKGLYITARPHFTNGRKAGAILSFDWGNANTKITVYYRDAFGTHGSQGIGNYSFIIDQYTPSFNKYYHNYTVRPYLNAQLQQALPNDTVNCDLVYIQGLSGVKTKFYMPNINFLKADGDVAINKAELILQVDPSTLDNDYQPPARVALVAFDSLENQVLISDYYEDQGGVYFGGTWDATKKQYRFNIAHHLQDLLNGEKKDHGLVLVASGGGVNAHRVVFGGGTTTSPYKMRLKVAYTKLN